MTNIFKLILVLILVPAVTDAQKRRQRLSKTDTLAITREFATVCNVYKQVPLYLDVTIANSTNYVTGPSDTSTARAEFYLVPGSSYVRFGEMEQLVNDSTALLVSSSLRRMILFQDARPVVAQLRANMGVNLPDSSIAALGKNYRSSQSTSGDTSIIELSGRAVLRGTDRPRERIVLKYDSKSRTPFSVVTTRCALVPITAADYNSMLSSGEGAGRLIALPDEQYALVKEAVSTFLYNNIHHQKTITIPASIASRVEKNSAGEIVPAKGYETYTVTLN